MSIGIHNNLAMMNSARQYKVNTANKTKSMEKLSSGYRINKSADDVAGLTISEKMRAQIRALDQGTRNAQDGVSWVQVGDGALNEVHALLQRMRELTIQSLNDTNTEIDRAACQAEFDALQSEIDRITGTTEFNSQNIFDEHELPYYQYEGNIKWEQSQVHIISDDNNDLSIRYFTAEGEPKDAEITIPAGDYTTQELIDEIDDAFTAQGLDKEGLVFEYTQYGTCNVNLEGGDYIGNVGGSLSYLLYESYEGGSFGALVGTTIFRNEYVELDIVTGQNDHLSFDIESFDGSKSEANITIPAGSYTRGELIDYLNNQLAGTDVTATRYGTGIKLEGANSIVTGFKGNMFKIDETLKKYHSVFYDNVKYGSVTMTEAVFKGGTVIPQNAENEEHNKYVIDSTNNQLTLQPNGMDTAVTLTIPEGEYTVQDMVNKLNDLFDEKGLELEASVRSTTESGVTYSGIQIESEVSGRTSSIGLDASSSAYDTLFRTRTYNTYTTVKPTWDDTEDREASVTGGKIFASTDLPLMITAGDNDAFTLNVDGTEYTITLGAGDYASVTDIVNEINTVLTDASAPIGYKNKVEAVVSGSQIKLQATSGSGVQTVKVSASGTNTGYEDLFVERTVTYDYTPVVDYGSSTEKPSVTLDTVVGTTTVFETTNNTLNITFNGKTYTINFPAGTVLSQDDIIAQIESTIPESTQTVNNTFQDVSAQGTSTDKNFTEYDTGNAPVYGKSYSDTGYSLQNEGDPGLFDNNEPAKITMSYAVPETIKLDDTCNQFQITINGTTRSMTLDNKEYTRAELVNALQSKINSEFGNYSGGVDVSLDGSNKLVFTGRLTDEYGNAVAGANNTISCSTSTSTLLKKLHTVESAATVTMNQPLQSSINIQDGSNIFAFSYTDESGTHQVELELSPGNYTPTTLKNELNQKLQDGNYDVTASLSGNYLKLSTVDKGTDTKISYSTETGGTVTEALYGNLIAETAATATANQKLQDSIVIDDTSNIFNMTVNGSPCNMVLKNGTYTPQQFVAMLNDKFTENNAGITATLGSDNKITYTTTEKGDDASFSITYNGGGSAMQAMYGQTTTIIPGIDAEFTSDGKLVLTGTQNGGSISVTPTDVNIFLQPTEIVSLTEPTSVSGYSSTEKAKIDGVSLTQEPITIDEYNNELSFSYYKDGTKTTVALELTEGDYTYEQLRQTLQSEIDADAGSNQLTVSVTSEGVVIEANTPGSKYYMTDFAGDFYRKVIGSCTTTNKNVSVTNRSGTQTDDPAYTVGRKDISGGANIKTGVNDTLSLDFTHNGTVETFTMTLDAGNYSGPALVTEIQKKLDEQLVAAGLEAGTIEVGIGGVNTGVSGSNDDRALTFKLSTTTRLPENGQYIIDGVSGNAAFSVFYQTEGELIPAYVKGAKDISEGVTIYPGANTFAFKVDDVPYSVEIPEGDYTSEEVIDTLNDLFKNNGIPVGAEMEDSRLKISYSSIGKHSITDVSGPAKKELFFLENGEDGERSGVKIQLSGNVYNSVTIDKPLVNTSFLRINSLAITRPKYANKTLVRLDNAINTVSEIRSDYGSMQNRLEHTIANNENTAENTSAAESRKRDTDMASKMVQMAKSSILEQASQAMVAQARSLAEGVLQLLQE